MYDAGLANLESFDAEIYDNTFENVKYGMRVSLGGGNNYVHDNVFESCSQCEYFGIVVVALRLVSFRYRAVLRLRRACHSTVAR